MLLSVLLFTVAIIQLFRLFFFVARDVCGQVKDLQVSFPFYQSSRVNEGQALHPYSGKKENEKPTYRIQEMTQMTKSLE